MRAAADEYTLRTGSLDVGPVLDGRSIELERGQAAVLTLRPLSSDSTLARSDRAPTPISLIACPASVPGEQRVTLRVRLRRG